MAKLSFIRGAATGKMGEFVGAKWKGINYIRLYAKPSNPRTEGQVSIRLVFKALSLFASALFSKGLLELIPPAKRMTERNSVFKANKQMLSNKTFTPALLQVAKSNFGASVNNLDCNIAANNFVVTGTSVIPLEIPQGIKDDEVTLHAFIYDTAKGIAVGYHSDNATLGSSPINYALAIPNGFDTPAGSLKEDCRVYVFHTAVSENDKLLISQTYSCGIA